ncbi:MAG: hypothetical protein HY747_09080 [Elusimicrobia bacterium]|nr:hypothetical protein [Elusimicrobiota bacterium]
MTNEDLTPSPQMTNEDLTPLLMKQPLLLGFDAGSSSIKGVLYDPSQKKFLAAARLRIAAKKYSAEGALCVEHAPEEILRGAEKILRTLAAKAPACRPIRAAIAAQRSSFLLVDAETYQALTPVISWQDLRGAPLVKKLSSLNSLVYQKTGLYLTPYYTISKLLWLFQKDRDLKSKAEQGRILLAFLPAYLAGHLTRERTFAVDPTQAQRSLLLNIKTCGWDNELLKVFGIPKKMLPPVKSSFDDYGTIAIEGRKEAVKLCATIGDQQAACLALSSVPASSRRPGLINLGTGGFMLLPTGRKLKRIEGLLSGILWKIENRTEYFLEIFLGSLPNEDLTPSPPKDPIPLLAPYKLYAAGGLSKNRKLLQGLADYFGKSVTPVAHADLTALGACAAASGGKAEIHLKFKTSYEPKVNNSITGKTCGE